MSRSTVGQGQLKVRVNWRLG